MIFKVIFGKQIHLTNSNDKKKLYDFLSFLPTIFKSLPSRYTLSYLDQDGDQITLKDQSDYEVLLSSGLKTVKVTIRENSQEFMEITNQIQIQPQHTILEQVKVVQNKIQEIKPQVQIKQEIQVPEIDDSLIQEKIRKMMPDLVSKIKSQITEQYREQSRISKNSERNEPMIIEEPFEIKRQEDKSQPKTGPVLHERVNCDGCGQKGIVGIRYKCAVCSDFDFCERCQATVEHDHPFLKIKTLKQTPVKIFTVVNHDDDSSLQINGEKINVPPCLQSMIQHGINFVEGLSRGQNNSHPFRNIFGRNRHCSRSQRSEPQKEQKCPQSKKPERKMQEVSQETILANANYVNQVFGDKFEKCLKWAQENPYMSKQELLNICLSSPNFFD